MLSFQVKSSEKLLLWNSGYPSKRQFIFHPYRGFIPIPFKNGKPVEVKGKKFEYKPYQGGFVPSEDKEGSDEQDFYTFHPYFGFIGTEKLKEEKEKEKNMRYNYHPGYGFVPIPEGESFEEAFFYDPFHGFVSESAANSSNKIYNRIDKTKKYIYTSHLGYIPDALAEKKYRFNFDKGFVLDSEDVEEEEDQMKVAEDATRFFYHPKLGYIPERQLNEDKSLKNVNLDEQFVFHPVYGFVPETP